MSCQKGANAYSNPSSMQVFGHWSLNGTPLHVGKDVPENGVPTHAPLLMLHPPATTDAGVNSPTNHGSLRHQSISSPRRRRVACCRAWMFVLLWWFVLALPVTAVCSKVMVFDSSLSGGPGPGLVHIIHLSFVGACLLDQLGLIITVGTKS